MPELFQTKNRIKKQNRNKGAKGKETIYNEKVTMEMKPKEKIILENKKQKILRNIQMGGFRGKTIQFRKPPTLEYRIRKRIKRPKLSQLLADQNVQGHQFETEEQFAQHFFGQPDSSDQSSDDQLSQSHSPLPTFNLPIAGPDPENFSDSNFMSIAQNTPLISEV